MARRDWLAGDIDRAKQNLEACPSELRDREWHYLHRVCHAELLRFKPAGSSGRLQYSPNGKFIACAGTGAFVRLMLLDANTGQDQFASAMVSSTDSALAFSPDGKQLVWASFVGPRLLAGNVKVKNPPSSF